MSAPLVNGHGNFGSLDADPPAAMRYTECRLQPLTDAMLLADLSEATVPFGPTFDDSQLEPLVMPARLPNLLLNGSQGIAVGMATSFAPHNLSELADAVVMVARNPEATVEELMRVLPGPDFPTGAAGPVTPSPLSYSAPHAPPPCLCRCLGRAGALFFRRRLSLARFPQAARWWARRASRRRTARAAGR